MVKGDIVLITFPFNDLSGGNLRPAIVLAASAMDLTVCFVTTQLQWEEPTNVRLQPTLTNGLKRSSLIRVSKIATIDKSLAKGLLGQLDANELSELDLKLKTLLGIK
jgi:mRNA interferase MazF